MKPSAVVPLIIITALSSFWLGSSVSEDAGDALKSRPPMMAVRSDSPKPSSKFPDHRSDGDGKFPERGRIAADAARQMTSQERLEALANGALIFDPAKQSEHLCGLIAILDKDEIAEAARLLGDAQNRGKGCAPGVWDALWTRWGRVDPQGGLAFFAKEGYGKSRVDGRSFMSGWLETDPQGALAWAKESKSDPLELAAAGMALAGSTGGDIDQLRNVLVELPPGDPVIKECLQDYYDLAILEGTHDPAAIYDGLPEELREDAWAITVQRISFTDPQTTGEWMSEHADKSGQKYGGTESIVWNLSNQNPAEATKWAAQLPAAVPEHGTHPVVVAYSLWAQRDSVAAQEWLETQPPDAPGIAHLLLPGSGG